MLKEIQIDEKKNKQCWLAYLDLLGTSKRIESPEWEDVFEIYAESLQFFKRDGCDEHLIFKTSFSDSFFYTPLMQPVFHIAHSIRLLGTSSAR